MSYSLSRNGGASDEPSPFGFFSEGFFSAGFFSPSPVEGSFLFLLEDLEDLVEVGIATTTTGGRNSLSATATTASDRRNSLSA